MAGRPLKEYMTNCISHAVSTICRRIRRQHRLHGIVLLQLNSEHGNNKIRCVVCKKKKVKLSP
jgi:hypothetical protein